MKFPNNSLCTEEMLDPDRKRITLKPISCPNPLFEKWIEEWRDEAASRNSDLKYCYDKALKSLRKYPIKLNSGKQCLILKNFGTQLCQKLDKKLAEYQKVDTEVFISDDPDTVQSSLNEVVKRKKGTGQKSDESPFSSPRKKKPYVPGWRSGPYAILITLYREQLKSDYCGYLRKDEIQQKAQELCDASFLKPDPGSYYTAWNSMTTLVNKALVNRIGNPAKFSLTKEGEELGKKLFEEMNSGSDCISKSSLQKDIPDKHYTIYLSDDEIIPGPSSLSSYENSKKVYELLVEKPYEMNISDIETDALKNLNIRLKTNNPKKFKSPRKKYPATVSDSEEDTENVKIPIPLVDLTDENIESTVPSGGDPILPDWISENANSDYKHLVNKPSCSSNSAISEDQYIFLPGDFEVILLVDTQEITGGTRHSLSDDTIRELTKIGTKFEVRHLKVGDFLWIARHHDGKELVLPYIVERKRMDDLGSSIKDGRFHEQKFRLRQCGLQNVIYLVEKYGNETRLGLPLSTLYQAAMNTQIVDNFQVKFTSNHYQSMIYLSVMTTLLTSSFKDKTLISCLKNNLPKFNIEDDLISLITFEEFTKTSVKNKIFKVREMFIKHLLQLKGLSVDKALAITELYPTPRSLITAFHRAGRPEILLAGIQCGSMNRNIGPALSKIVHQLYCSKNFH